MPLKMAWPSFTSLPNSLSGIALSGGGVKAAAEAPAAACVTKADVAATGGAFSAGAA